MTGSVALSASSHIESRTTSKKVEAMDLSKGPPMVLPPLVAPPSPPTHSLLLWGAAWGGP